MKIWLVGAALLLWPAVAAAESYDVLSWNQDRLAAVDRDSVIEVGGLKRVRITVIYAQPRTDAAQAYRGMVGVQEFDCAQGRYHTLLSTPFDEAGAPIPALANEEATAWSAITAGTLGDDERQRVCAGAWAGEPLKTRLPVLLAAYMLRRDPPPAAAQATVQAAAAAANATDAAAVAPR